MGENPILYSELIKDDGSFDKLIAKLEEIIQKYNELLRAIQKDATEASSSLSKVSGASEDNRKEIQRTAEETEKLLESYRDWTSELRATQREEQKLKQAKKEATQVDKLMIQFTNNKIGSYNRLAAEYGILKLRLNEMSSAERNAAKGKEMENRARRLYEEMSRLQKATGKYTLEVGHYQNAMQALPTPLNQVTQAIITLGSNMRQVFQSDMPAGEKAVQGFNVAIVGLIAVVIALGKALKGLVSQNAEFEQQNANLATVLGTTKDNIQNLTSTALELGRTTEWTASQVTQLQTELAKLGFGEGSIIAMQKSILQFATALGADLGEAANMAGAAIRAFNLTSKDAEEVMGVLAVGVNNSALTFDRLKYSMGTVFPVANAFGLSIKDATALLGTLANAGFSAESAATATRNMLLNLADANGKLAQRTGGAAKSFDDIIDKLMQLRKEGADLSEIFDLTDKRSVAAFSALMSGADTAKELRARLEEVSGELERIQKERLNTIQGQTLLLKSAWQGLILSFRESNGVIKSLIEDLTQLTQGITNLLFASQAIQSRAQEGFLEKFRDYYKEAGADLTKEYMVNYLTAYRKELDVLEQDQSRKGKKAYEEALSRYKGMYAGYKIMLQQIQNDEDEAERQRQIKEQERITRAEELTKAQKQQRLKELQARIDEIKMQISMTEKGTKEMLDLRLKLVEAERDLEVEKNIQAEGAAKKDMQIINEKFNHDRLQTEEDYWKEVSQLRQQALQADKTAIDAQISLTQEGTDKMLQLRIASLEKQRDIEIEKNKQKDEKIQESEESIRKRYYDKIFQMEADFLTKRAKENLQAYQELEAAEFSLLDRNERQKTQFRLQQEKERLMKILEINSTATNQMSAMEIASIQATIDAIEKEQAKMPYNNIYELLGLGLDDKQQDALNTALSSIKDSIDSITDSWLEAADAAVQAADKQVDAAQKMLDAEIEARNQGYANNVETAQKELENARKNQEQALREREKAQRAQLALDTAMQASSLITATANIWKALGGIPVIGPALAVAAIASMWGSFAVAKVKAIQVSQQSEKYGEGTVELLEGGSHASGHDIDLGVTKRGKRRRAEGGEYFAIINKRNSARYRNVIPDVINSFNDGTFAEKYQKTSKLMDGIALNIGSGTDVSVLEKNVKAIREQGERQITSDGERIIIKYKNLTQTIKKR